MNANLNLGGGCEYYHPEMIYWITKTSVIGNSHSSFLRLVTKQEYLGLLVNFVLDLVADASAHLRTESGEAGQGR